MGKNNPLHFPEGFFTKAATELCLDHCQTRFVTKLLKEASEINLEDSK